MPTTTLTEVPTDIRELLPAAPWPTASTPASEASERAHQLNIRLRAERDAHAKANHARIAELVELLDAGKSTDKLLATIADSASAIAALDAQIAAVTTASTRLSQIASAARKADPVLARHADACNRAKRAWNDLERRAWIEYPQEVTQDYQNEMRAARGEPTRVTNTELREAWLQAERLEFAERLLRKFDFQ